MQAALTKRDALRYRQMSLDAGDSTVTPHTLGHRIVTETWMLSESTRAFPNSTAASRQYFKTMRDEGIQLTLMMILRGRQRRPLSGTARGSLSMISRRNRTSDSMEMAAKRPRRLLVTLTKCPHRILFTTQCREVELPKVLR